MLTLILRKVVVLLLVTTAPLLAQSSRGERAQYQAIVNASYTGVEGRIVEGAKRYRTISAAIHDAPAEAVAAYNIFVTNGRYREKLTVLRPSISLIGESRDSTVLTFDAAADTPNPEGGTYGTRGSFTIRIAAPDFRASHITIENAFDYDAHVAKPADDPTRYRNLQGVAVMLHDGSDRAVFENCKITGNQDTLFPNAGRSYFRKCEIIGHVDFIFGAGQAVFDDCDIISLDRGNARNNGYVTAASTPLSKPYGFLIVNSRLKKEAPTMAAGSVALGRPWHPFADPEAVASVVFYNTWMDDHISAKGWEQMSSVDAQGNRLWFNPENARLFEYASMGPGAIASSTRRVLTIGEARAYTIDKVLNGWKP